MNYNTMIEPMPRLGVPLYHVFKTDIFWSNLPDSFEAQQSVHGVSCAITPQCMIQTCCKTRII